MAPVYRPPKEESEQIEFLRESLAVLRQMLEQNPPPDTFLGRKTQEPFPTESDRRRAEDEEIEAAKQAYERAAQVVRAHRRLAGPVHCRTVQP